MVGVALMLLSVTGCAGEDEGSEESKAAPKKGGIYRIQAPSFEFTGGFDPTGEYLGIGFNLYSCCLIRTVMGYKHVAGSEGNELVPDLAAEEPEISADGRTYTFTLKDGVKFGPPVDREVISKDIAYAFERIGTESLVAQYGFYYDVIEGMAAFKEGKAKTISGIETPDEKTISFTLTEPTGDFPYRMAMPATAPIPEEVAKCFTKAGEYGRYLISSGPYMLEGSDELKISSCKAMKPISGFDPSRRLAFVRNPNYDPASDSKEARENFIDGLDYTLNTNIKDIFNKIEAGELDGEIAPPPPEVLRKYSQSESLKNQMTLTPLDVTWYISLNLTQAPFDDIHVRKAANWVIDKAGLRRPWGGELRGNIAQHIVPDAMFNGALEDYAPYQTEGDAGDLEKAKDEMRKSRYDTNKDGVCDASECKNVYHVSRNEPPFTDMEPTIEQAFKMIGIELKTRQFQDPYPVIQDVSKNAPITSVAGWFKDYPDPSTFMVLFDSRSILPQGNINYALVGVTPEQAKDIKAEGTVEGIPNVDADIDECSKLTDEDRLTCWQELDKKLMEEVVPWIPYLNENAVDIIGPAVTKFEVDQFAGEASYAHVAVDPSKQK